MGEGRTVVHCNRSLAHQVRIAKALRDGMGAEISFSSETQADTHVVLGPWFALRRWRNHSRVLYIDRAYWGDPECVSVHWLKGGEKVRTKGNPYRCHPELQPLRDGKTIYLCDYGEGPRGEYDAVRRHPAEEKGPPLEEVLRHYGRAVGRRTTALVTAHFMGLQVETDDPNSPVWGIEDREQWARDLAWHNWSLEEIRTGEAWQALKS